MSLGIFSPSLSTSSSESLSNCAAFLHSLRKGKIFHHRSTHSTRTRKDRVIKNYWFLYFVRKDQKSMATHEFNPNCRWERRLLAFFFLSPHMLSHPAALPTYTHFINSPLPPPHHLHGAFLKIAVFTYTHTHTHTRHTICAKYGKGRRNFFFSLSLSSFLLDTGKIPHFPGKCWSVVRILNRCRSDLFF